MRDPGNNPTDKALEVVSHEQQSRDLKSLPDKIREFVLNDSTFSISENEILERIKEVGPALVFLVLQLQRSRDTFNDYGPDHPNSRTWVTYCKTQGYDPAMT